jgi:hypothetical protein
MRRLVFVFLVSTLLLTLGFVYEGNIPAVKASSSIYQGDLILTGNNVTTIEGRFNMNGSIIVKDNATLHLKNAYVNLTQTSNFQYYIMLSYPSNGNPRLLAYNSTITSNALTTVYLQVNSTATIDNSTISHHLTVAGNSKISISSGSYVGDLQVYDSSLASIYNSTINSMSSYSSEVSVYDSEIITLIIRPESVNFTVSRLEPRLISYWNFVTNCSVSILTGGSAPNLTLINTNVSNWNFGFYSSNVSITNSTIMRLDAIDSSRVHLQSTVCGVTFNYDYSMLLTTSSSIATMYAWDSSRNWLLNSTYGGTYIYDSAKVYVSWYLDVHVIDSIDQDVPSSNVTVTFPNATLAESELTDVNGWARLTLLEKMMNATGEYPVGNYTVEATYDIYSDATTVNMTENQQTTLTLEDFIIPEFPSFLILPLFMIATLLAVIVYRKRAKSDRFYKK